MADDLRIALEARIRELEARLDELRRYETLGRLIGGVAHDFNNVLSVVTTLSELQIRFGGSDATAREDLVEIRQAAERGSDLVRQLMAFARSDPGDPVATDPNLRLEGTLKLFRKLLPEDFEVVVETGTEVPLTPVDPPEIDQMLLNLAAYSREWMPGGGRVRLTTGRSSEGWSVIGVGLEPLPCPPDREASRSGPDAAGLEPIERLLERRGGRLVVEESGARVAIHLPPAHAVEDGRATRAAHGSARRVLIVESNDGVREATHRLLRRMGFEVMTTESVAGALEQIRAEDPEVVISAAVLRDGWGAELVRRAEDAGSEAAFLFVTGHEAHPAVREIREAGLQVLRKPAGADALEKAIEEGASFRPGNR